MFRRSRLAVDLAHRFIAKCDYLSDESWSSFRKFYLHPLYGVAQRITKG